VGAAALAAGGVSALGGCASSAEQQLEELVSKSVKDKDIVTLTVAADQVVEATEFEEAPFEDYLTLQGTYELPLGSLVHQMDSSLALVLLPGEEGESLRKIGTLNLSSGAVSTVVSEPVATGKNVVIYDARASRSRLIWVEFDLGEQSWRTYVMPLEASSTQNAQMVEEGSVDFEPPMLAAAGDKVYWTAMPTATGAQALTDSYLKAFGSFGQNGSSSSGQTAAASGESYTVFTSHGRMITNPLVSDGIVTFVPRVDTTNIYYQLTALNCSDDKPVDFQILPQSMRVSDAVYLRDAFAFAIEGNYTYADGLSRFGTYRPLEDGTYLHIGRPPSGPAVYFKGCLVVKSTLNIVGFDPIGRRSFVIETPPRCSDFGEALVGWGVQDRIVTTSLRLAEDKSRAEATTVRVFA
jgi:hypothetical protein